MDNGFKNWQLYQNSYSVAMEIFFMTKKFPPKEYHSLTKNLIHNARAISTKLAKAWIVKENEADLKKSIKEVSVECVETRNWLSFAKDCAYLAKGDYLEIVDELETIRKSLVTIYNQGRIESENIFSMPMKIKKMTDQAR